MKTYNSIFATFLGFVYSFYEEVRGITHTKSDKHFSNFTEVKTIKAQTKNSLTGVGVYKNNKNVKKIIKYVSFATRNRIVQQLYNEYYFLTSLSKVINTKSNKLHIPTPEKLVEEANRVAIVSEFCEGKLLTQLAIQKRLDVMKSIITTLERTSTSTLLAFPKRNKLYILTTFHLFLAKAFLNDTRNWKTYGTYLATFYHYYLFTNSGKYVIAHRDLHSNNVLFSEKQITLLDPEVMALCQEQTDLAILAKSYTKEIGDSFISFLRQELISSDQKKRFIGLSIYYAIQIMSLRSKNDPDYKEGNRYLKTYLPRIMSEFFPNTSIVEKFHALGLRLIHLLPQPTSTKSLILCYHSISSDGWRFATSPELFEEQMKIVASRNPVSLTALLTKNKPGIAITFDDGYEDFLTNALPILKKYHIPATMFLLGDPEKANHAELQNTKSMLSISQIKSLQKAGVELGFHTSTHSDMRNMSESELEQEIKISKETLEKKLGYTFKYFAYPRGLYNTRIIQMVKEAGFQKAFTVDGGSVNKNGSKFLVNRISIEGTTTREEFNTLLSPLGILFETIYMETLKTKESICFLLKGYLAQNRKENLS